jgi:hypothetical protein
MPRSRVLDVVPEMGITRIFHPLGNGKGGFAIEERQDVTELVESNKELAKEQPTGQDGMRLVASIPMSVYMQLQKKGITRDPKAFKAWLNDRDNRFFRTTVEKV